MVVHSGFGNEMLESTNRQCIAVPLGHDNTEEIRSFRPIATPTSTRETCTSSVKTAISLTQALRLYWSPARRCAGRKDAARISGVWSWPGWGRGTSVDHHSWAVLVLLECYDVIDGEHCLYIAFTMEIKTNN